MNREQIELLLDRGEIRVAEYLVELPPREMLEAKLHKAIRLARGQAEWSEPLRVDKKLSNADSWREVHEEDQAALRPGLQDISISRT